MLVANPAHPSWLLLRTLGVLSVWAPAAVVTGIMLESALPVAILTAAMLAVSHVHAKFESAAVAAASARVVRGPDAPGGPGGARDQAPDAADGRCADHFIATEFAAARRGRQLTLAMFGFDGFDEFSRREGPAAAAEALREFGQVLKRMTRQMNLSARYGWRADAFLSVLSDADTAAAEIFVQRVRDEVSRSVITLPPVSVGIVEYRDDIASPDAFVRAAERALDASRAGLGRGPHAQRNAWPVARHASGTMTSPAQPQRRLHAL